MTESTRDDVAVATLTVVRMILQSVAGPEGKLRDQMGDVFKVTGDVLVRACSELDEERK